MKIKSLSILLGAVAVAVVLVSTIAATIVVKYQTPAAFYDDTGTNAVILGGDHAMQTLSGSTLSAALSTNLPVLTASNKTNTLVIVDGVITGVQ